MKQLTHLKFKDMKNTTKQLREAGYKVVKYTAPKNVILENSLTGRASAFVELLPYFQNEGFSFMKIN